MAKIKVITKRPQPKYKVMQSIYVTDKKTGLQCLTSSVIKGRLSWSAAMKLKKEHAGAWISLERRVYRTKVGKAVQGLLEAVGVQ